MPDTSYLDPTGGTLTLRTASPYPAPPRSAPPSCAAYPSEYPTVVRPSGADPMATGPMVIDPAVPDPRAVAWPEGLDTGELPPPDPSARLPHLLAPADQRRIDLHAALTAACVPPDPADLATIHALSALDGPVAATVIRWITVASWDSAARFRQP
ncbi:hypothetical protein [Streptomyces sp. NPDC058045]|uniref:hypothetical protein n=1 Tax=Streptomyces sp. NPDC058045 TaxID=3346311 RepID=UPI0036F03A35